MRWSSSSSSSLGRRTSRTDVTDGANINAIIRTGINPGKDKPSFTGWKSIRRVVPSDVSYLIQYHISINIIALSLIKTVTINSDPHARAQHRNVIKYAYYSVYTYKCTNCARAFQYNLSRFASKKIRIKRINSLRARTTDVYIGMIIYNLDIAKSSCGGRVAAAYTL